MNLNKRNGVTLVDTLCGLFIMSLSLGLYFQTNQVMKHQVTVSNHQLIQKRKSYENTLVKDK